MVTGVHGLVGLRAQTHVVGEPVDERGDVITLPLHMEGKIVQEGVKGYRNVMKMNVQRMVTGRPGPVFLHAV